MCVTSFPLSSIPDRLPVVSYFYCLLLNVFTSYKLTMRNVFDFSIFLFLIQNISSLLYKDRHICSRSSDLTNRHCPSIRPSVLAFVDPLCLSTGETLDTSAKLEKINTSKHFYNCKTLKKCQC